MTTQLSTFDFKNNSIRVVEIDGEPWFVASDVVNVLGLINTTIALQNISEAKVQNYRVPGTRGRMNKIISEGALYKLILRSNRAESEVFSDWVTDVVLPAIRKDGGYVAGEEKVSSGELSEDEFIAKAMQMMQRKIDRLAQENASMSKELTRVTIAEYTALNHVYSHDGCGSGR